MSIDPAERNPPRITSPRRNPVRPQRQGVSRLSQSESGYSGRDCCLQRCRQAASPAFGGRRRPSSRPGTDVVRRRLGERIEFLSFRGCLSRAAGEPVFEAPGALPPSGIALASHGVFRVKLIRLRRPLACHPRSGAKRSGAGSEATLTRQRPDTLSRASAPLRALGCLCGLCRAHSFWHCASPLAFGSEA